MESHPRLGVLRHHRRVRVVSRRPRFRRFWRSRGPSKFHRTELREMCDWSLLDLVMCWKLLLRDITDG